MAILKIMLQVEDLPFAVYGLRGATLNNEIYMFGETLTIKSNTYCISHFIVFIMQVEGILEQNM